MSNGIQKWPQAWLSEGSIWQSRWSAERRISIRELARSYGAEAIKTLAEIMKEYQRELCGFGGTPQRRNEWADRYVTEH
jgi:hypothetical protein